MVVVLVHVKLAFVTNTIMPWDLFSPTYPGSCRYGSCNFSLCNAAIWS